MSTGISYQISAVDKISKVADKISSKVDRMDEKIERIAKTSDRSSKKMKKSFKGMSKGIAGVTSRLRNLAVAGAGFFAMKNVFAKGMEFETSMAGVAAITNATGKDLKIFENESRRMAEKFGLSASDVANSFLDIGSAKAELLTAPMELAKIVEQTVLLSKAGGTGMKETTDAMTKSLNIFLEGADSAKRFSDVMIKGTVVGAAKLDEFSQSILNAGGSAFNAGMDFEETTALIQLLSKGGEVGARAGTALNAFFARMSKNFGDVDISSGEKLLSFLDKLDVVVQKGDFNLSKEFGEESARAVRILLAQKKFLPSFLKDIRDSGGATEVAAKIRMSTSSEKLARARARLDNKMLDLFLKLEPVVSRMTEDFTNWVDSLDASDIQNFSDAMDTMISALQNIGKGFKILFGVLEKIGTFLGETLAKFHFWANEKNNNNRPTTVRNFSQKELNEMMGASVMGGSSNPNDLSNQLPPSFHNVPTKSEVEITLKGNTENVVSVKSKTENLVGSKRKSKVKSNMGT